MIVRKINLENDYPILKTWWERRNSGAPETAVLPEIGMVAESEGVMIACAWLYCDVGGKCAIVEWEATNPDVGPMRAVAGINTVFGFFEHWSREGKLNALLSWTGHENGSTKILERRHWRAFGEIRHSLMAYTGET